MEWVPAPRATIPLASCLSLFKKKIYQSHLQPGCRLCPIPPPPSFCCSSGTKVHPLGLLPNQRSGGRCVCVEEIGSSAHKPCLILSPGALYYQLSTHCNPLRDLWLGTLAAPVWEWAPLCFWWATIFKMQKKAGGGLFQWSTVLLIDARLFQICFSGKKKKEHH